MDNHDHMSEVLDLFSSLISKIDLLLCHPKHKLLLYHRFVLSKVSWHFTIANLGKTWVAENLDNLVLKKEGGSSPYFRLAFNQSSHVL